MAGSGFRYASDAMRDAASLRKTTHVYKLFGGKVELDVYRSAGSASRWWTARTSGRRRSFGSTSNRVTPREERS